MEETEIKLKEMIISRYGSIKKFCDKISMPWTTLDSILKRGVANSNISNIIKITAELNIDTESLAYGKIIEISSTENNNIQKLDTFTQSESKLIDIYRKLNLEGQKKLLERAKELQDLGYTLKGDESKMA